MLLKLTCEPAKVILPISLLFDDGTTKKVDLTQGMYATFEYMAHGMKHEITGIVTEIFTSAKKMVPIPPECEPGYLCDPNYVNSGVIGMPPFPPGPKHHHHRPHQAELDIRNYVEVKGVGKDAGSIVKIDLYSIIDVFTIYTEAECVKSPVDSTAVKMLRVTDDGVLQYSTDISEWVDAKSTDSNEVNSLKASILLLTDKINELEAELDSMKNPNVPIDQAGE